MEHRNEVGWKVRTTTLRPRLKQFQVIERLESRSLLSGIPVTGPLPFDASTDPADVLSASTALGTLPNGLNTSLAGSIDANGADVDWFEFTLTEASEIRLGISSGVVSLYNNSIGDIHDRLRGGDHRLVAQASSLVNASGLIERQLAAGTYYVAISGVGNLYFSSVVSGSGLPGLTGDYSLDISVTALELDPASDPIVLSQDVSPLVARIGFSGALNFVPTVRVFDANGAPVALNWINFNTQTFELQISPARSWSAGTYQIEVQSPDGTVHFNVPLEVPTEAAGEQGQLGNDTPATAIDLGDLGSSGLIQIPGTIGDDPYYVTGSGNPALSPGNDVDLYHFRITSDTPVGVQIEVFAGRINSSLDSGISLYRRNSVTGQLEFVAGNNNTYNPTRGANGGVPLFSDSALAAGLSAGDYYVAVAHGMTVVSPLEFQGLGETGSNRFDPAIPHSGAGGWSVGPYVLNVQIVGIPAAPEVVDVSIVDGSTLAEAPTEVTVQFSQFMNLTSLAVAAFQATSQSTISGIYFQDGSGRKYFPRLVEFDANLVARFLMLDRLSAGQYTLHLNGAQGIANVVGAPLVGNSANGEYVVSFSVGASPLGTSGGSVVWNHSGQNDSLRNPQELGVLFPRELQHGVTMRRSVLSNLLGQRDTDDFYEFEVLQTQSYTFSLNGIVLPRDATLRLLDVEGNIIAAPHSATSQIVTSHLQPGTYILQVSGWPLLLSRAIDYRVVAKLVGNGDNAPPLYSGPSPAVGIQLVGSVGPDRPIVTPPPPVGGGSSGGGFPGGGGVPTGPVGGGSSNGSNSTGGGASSSQGLTSFRNSGRLGGTYLNDPLGTSRVSVPELSDNFVIAIPTTVANGGSIGTIRQATRATIRSAGLRDGLSPIGLSELADGLVGQSSGEGLDSVSSLKSMRKLRSLINSELSSVARRNTDKGVQTSQDSNTSEIELSASSDGDDRLNGTSDDRSNHSQSEGVDPDHREASRMSAPDRGITQVTAGKRRKMPGVSVQTVSQSEFVGPDSRYASTANSTSKIVATENLQEINIDSRALYAQLDFVNALDAFFAGGIFLLLIDLGKPRSGTARKLKSRRELAAKCRV